MQQITANVFVESGMPACNLGLITTTAGNVIVDTPGSYTDALKWRDEINKKGTLRYVINSEEHPDHCSNSWFFPSPLITSRITREKVIKMQPQFKERARKADLAVQPFLVNYELKIADITFVDDMTLYLGNHSFNLFAVPGHSAGGIAIFIPEERLVFATDCVFSHYKTWLQEAMPETWLASLVRLAALEVDYIVPGHGQVCSKDYIREQIDIIQNWVATVKDAIRQGWTVDEAITRVKNPDPYPKQPEVTFVTDEQLHKMAVTRLYQLYAPK